MKDAVAGDSGKKVSRSPSDSEPTWSPSCWQPVGESKTRSRAGWGTHVIPGTGGGEEEERGKSLLVYRVLLTVSLGCQSFP